MTEFEKAKKKLIEDVVALHTKLSELILYNDLKEESWNEIVTDLDTFRMTYIQTIYEYLLELQETLWDEMNTIWCQQNMTSEMWHNYKWMFDKPQLIEQKQMAVCKKKLKRSWSSFRDRLKSVKKVTPDGAVENTGEEKT